MDAEISLKQQKDDVLLMVLSGSWRLASSLPSADELKKQIDPNRVRHIAFETGELKDWDSALLTFLIKVDQFCSQNRIRLETEGLPEGARRLLKLATTVPEREGARKELTKESFLDVIAEKTIVVWRSTVEMVDFLGEVSVAFGRLLTGQRHRFVVPTLCCFSRSAAPRRCPLFL